MRAKPRVSTFEFPPIWKEFRTKSQLCDGLVICNDGVEFKIHRAILAAVSPYFKVLFTNSINRDHSEASVARMDVPGDIFKTLLDFAYSGTCAMEMGNVKDLIKYADQYQILDVVQLCCSYLMEELNPANCLEILKFANQYFCTDLENRGRLFIRHNFFKLLKESYEFYHISAHHLEEILRDDELNIKTEETVFEAVKMWVNYALPKRKVHLFDLLKCVSTARKALLSAAKAKLAKMRKVEHKNVNETPNNEFSSFIQNNARMIMELPLALGFGTLSFSAVQEISKWHPIDEDPDCKEYMQDILAVLGGLGQEDDVDYINNYLFRPRIPYTVLFAVGGWSAGSPTNFLETYDSRADRWLFSVDTDSSPRAYHGLCTLNGLIYMIGSFCHI
ncbi:hypothetical protein NQ317_000304 [Molorchus minor]|uniref:BTB domain-containing protein n=1 Tax=Molorchus minor TaxID=1323400 RepID=A0ABQ9IWY5_9CUCU|nr:hypothetical protein NQ317_000304 [Molorchus minor]